MTELIRPYSLFAVKKLLSAAGSSDSLCTWRDRYAGSCAADPGASQNGLSVGKKKEKLRFLYFCQTVRKTDMNVLSLCVSTEHTVYRIWKQKKKRCGDKRMMRLTKVSKRRCAFFLCMCKIQTELHEYICKLESEFGTFWYFALYDLCWIQEKTWIQK